MIKEIAFIAAMSTAIGVSEQEIEQAYACFVADYQQESEVNV